MNAVDFVSELVEYFNDKPEMNVCSFYGDRSFNFSWKRRSGHGSCYTLVIARKTVTTYDKFKVARSIVNAVERFMWEGVQASYGRKRRYPVEICECVWIKDGVKDVDPFSAPSFITKVKEWFGNNPDETTVKFYANEFYMFDLTPPPYSKYSYYVEADKECFFMSGLRTTTLRMLRHQAERIYGREL